MNDSLAKRVRVMGILNVTPDSFSDGGRFVSTAAILAQVGKMVADGADIIDIGGESSRPFAEAVSLEEETARVLPAIQAIRKEFSIPISVDTTKVAVARKAIEAGADIINDISALRFESAMVELAGQTGASVVLMHMQGTPGNMQKNPDYHDLLGEITDFLHARIEWAVAHGLKKERIIVDPGIGFGKTPAHNLSILKHLDRFRALGCPVLLGHSRKAFIGSILDRDPDDRDTATAIIAALSCLKDIDIIRVHDVDKTVQAVKLAAAIEAAP
ncbi:MAG: dihydropteroate synthase [Desulfurivibrionaceae bacterium]|nr:dihydropteroate synthase [Desulfobulbales bacterium]MDT8335439.1 dihydropteroate synthase [Desulfurivibrionaceae bacterium]